MTTHTPLSASSTASFDPLVHSHAPEAQKHHETLGHTSSSRGTTTNLASHAKRTRRGSSADEEEEDGGNGGDGSSDDEFVKQPRATKPKPTPKPSSASSASDGRGPKRSKSAHVSTQPGHTQGRSRKRRDASTDKEEEEGKAGGSSDTPPVAKRAATAPRRANTPGNMSGTSVTSGSAGGQKRPNRAEHTEGGGKKPSNRGASPELDGQSSEDEPSMVVGDEATGPVVDAAAAKGTSQTGAKVDGTGTCVHPCTSACAYYTRLYHTRMHTTSSTFEHTHAIRLSQIEPSVHHLRVS